MTKFYEDSFFFSLFLSVVLSSFRKTIHVICQIKRFFLWSSYKKINEFPLLISIFCQKSNQFPLACFGRNFRLVLASGLETLRLNKLYIMNMRAFCWYSSQSCWLFCFNENKRNLFFFILLRNEIMCILCCRLLCRVMKRPFISYQAIYFRTSVVTNWTTISWNQNLFGIKDKM